MAGGRTVWRAKDAAWWRREWIVELGEEFGSDGPSVIDWLECEAKSQNDGGCVKAGLKTAARGCFVDAVTVGHVLSRSVTLGLLVDYEDRDGRFECRISWWRADQERAMAANRKRIQRTPDPIDPGDPPPLSRSVPVGHAKSRPVPKCPPTGQDRTVQKKDNVNTNAELRSATVECFAYWQERCDHTQAKLTPDRERKIMGRLREGYTVAQIREAIEGAARAPFVNEAGKRFDDVELICRTGSKLESFIERATAVPLRAVGSKESPSEMWRAINGGGAA